MKTSVSAHARILGAAVVVTLASALGCATVVHGTHQNVEIITAPPGATATIYPSGLKTETPAKVSLRRKNAHTVRLELDGYRTHSAFINRVTSDAVVGNALVGGLVGVSIDADSGAAYRLVPDRIEVELEPLDSSGRAAD